MSELESGAVTPDGTSPGSSVSGEGATSEPSQAADTVLEDVVQRLLADDTLPDKLVEHPAFEKIVQKHTNRENANLRKQIETVNESVSSIRRYQEHLQNGLTPEQAEAAVLKDQETEERLAYVDKLRKGEITVTDQTPDNVGALSGDGAKEAAGKLLDRMKVSGESRDRILDQVGQQINFPTGTTLEDFVYDKVSDETERLKKASPAQSPVPSSAGTPVPTPSEADALQKQYTDEMAQAMKNNMTSQQRIDLRNKYRRKGLKI